MNEPTGLVDHFFRHESGRLVAVLTRRFGAEHLERIEDAVQTALLRAMRTWGTRGLPDNPSAWLTRVATNQVLDGLRHDGTVARAAPVLAAGEDAPPPDARLAGELDDDLLRMLFACADPELPARARLVLALKLVCGFGTAEIGARLFLEPANVQKVLQRGRDRLREAWSDQGPDGLARPERLEAVQRMVYLLFNEGYSSQREEEPIRRELCEEALRLGHLLVAHPVGDAGSSWALLALMTFHAARLEARLDEGGGLLLLEDQDRSRWDRDAIRRAFGYLVRSSTDAPFTRYHGEAAVLAEHCAAPTYADTRWGEIVELYEGLERIEPSPLYTLNRAIALAEWKGPAEGLALLRALTPPAWLIRYYLWDATLGELARRTGEHAAAVRHLERAVEGAPTRAERSIFAARLARARDGDSGR